jgi:hypothetical protein
MAIKKPTAEVRQEQVTGSAVTQSPGTKLALAGPAYKIQDMLSIPEKISESIGIDAVIPGLASGEVIAPASLYVYAQLGSNWKYLKSTSAAITNEKLVITKSVLVDDRVSNSYSYATGTKTLTKTGGFTDVSTGDIVEVHQFTSYPVVAEVATGADNTALSTAGIVANAYGILIDNVDPTVFTLQQFNGTAWVEVVTATINSRFIHRTAVVGATAKTDVYYVETTNVSTLLKLASFTDVPVTLAASAVINVVAGDGNSATLTFATTADETAFTAYDETAGTLDLEVIKIQDEDLAGYAGASLKVGYTASLPSASIDQKIDITDNSDAIALFGEFDVRSPLSYSYNIARTNGVSSMVVCPIDSGTSGNGYLAASESYTNVLDELELDSSIYAMSFATSNTAGINALIGHVTTQSLPANKKERIAFIGKSYSVTTKANRSSEATAISNSNATIGSKRILSVYSGDSYIKQSWPTPVISKVLTNNTFSMKTAVVYTYTDSLGVVQTVKVGTAVSATLVTNLIANKTLDVYVKVPGHYSATSEASKVAATNPQTPFTNTSVLGVDKIEKVSDWFTESHLDEIAGGGTYIVDQASALSSPYVRHQLSTDVTTVENSELNITRQVDYASKYYRGVVSPFIGKTLITKNTLDILAFSIKAANRQLVSNLGYLKDASLVSMLIPENKPDTVEVVVRVLPFYALNYVYITVQY